MGIDLIWFGVLLSVNMQTSFMHPPFGFALFYLRSVAPKEVKTSDIYWGSVPFVLIQVIMVTLIIAFPKLISVDSKTDMHEKIELKIDMGGGVEYGSNPMSYGSDESSTDSSSDKPASSEDEAPQLNFSTEEPAKK